MTKDQKSAINVLYAREDFHYNLLWEFCEHNGVNLKDAIHYIAEISAPPGCSGCKYVGPYLGNWRCRDCSRNSTDHYTPVDDASPATTLPQLFSEGHL